MITYLHINFNNAITLKFKINSTSIAQRWANQIRLAQSLNYDIDDRERFYGFNSHIEERQQALSLINNDIRIINSHERIITRELRDIDDQDTLNYLHHIFEVYHGLLDTQISNEFFMSAPPEVQRALADLNIHVHRCESVSRGHDRARVVVTYYSLPKTEKFDVLDYLHFTDYYKFGNVYINYVEIGKTLKSLAKDNDTYIADEALRPYTNFSADFNVKFYEPSDELIISTLKKVNEYCDTHRARLDNLGFRKNDPRLSTGMCHVASLDTNLSKDTILSTLRDNQRITQVWLE